MQVLWLDVMFAMRSELPPGLLSGHTHILFCCFLLKHQQMVIRQETKSSLKNKVNLLETNPIPKTACFQDRGGKSIPNNKMI